jgi:hypothetical protein
LTSKTMTVGVPAMVSFLPVVLRVSAAYRRGTVAVSTLPSHRPPHHGTRPVTGGVPEADRGAGLG